jgi:DNA-binding response OmpR family regulator/DNA-binding CsgD family transcriptional regulator
VDNFKILIADDEPYNIELFSEMLKQPNYEIVSATNGYEAVEVAVEEIPNLIILDWNMPRLDGLEALKAIKRIEKLIDIPVIMITGIMTSRENLLTAMNEGAIDFIRKPFEKLEFVARVKSMLLLSKSISEMKRAHEEKVENQKRELASSALRLIQVTELNNRMISDLNSIAEHTNKKGKEIIRGIINSFSIHSGENVWNEFETRFENVYETFYQQLIKRFSDLTPGERKLCALLRLNLSTKDIAAITFQNPQSIDVARYRLRKKFNLEQDENLVDFLMKIDS